MKYLLVGLTLILVACGGSPSEGDIQTAIAETAEAAPTPTPPPTLEPSRTPSPAPSSTPMPTCAELTKPVLDDMDHLLGEWDDARDVASNTARIALSEPVARLQSIRRQVDQLDFPACSRWRQVMLTTYMDHVIDGFLHFMEESESSSDRDFDLAGYVFDQLNVVWDLSIDSPLEPPYTLYFTALGLGKGLLEFEVPGAETERKELDRLFSLDRTVTVNDLDGVRFRVTRLTDTAYCTVYINGVLSREIVSSGPYGEIECLPDVQAAKRELAAP